MSDNNNLQPEFEAEIINEEELDEIELARLERRRKKRLKKRIRKLVLASIAVLCVAAIITTSLAVTREILGKRTKRGREVTVDIAMGMSTRQIAEVLDEAGAITNPFLFRVYSRLYGFDGKYSYGVYSVSNSIGYEELAKILMTEGQKAETVTVTIPEGTGINDYIKNVNGEKVTVPGIATILEKAGVCKKSDFFDALTQVGEEYEILDSADRENAYYALEGYLFPETYQMYSYDSKQCAVLAVRRMLEETEKRFTDKMRARAKKLGYSVNEIMTMASIIQMEAGRDDAELPNVAAVFYNRLKSDSFKSLGSSPTCYYGDSFKDDDGRYNTYNIEGLPPGPLCSPGIAAINAALYPTENTPYFYFVTDAKGNFYYHETYEEQLKTINKLQSDKNWIYEYFD